MRILHFTRQFSPISETFIYDTIHLLKKKNLDNCVATIIRENKIERPFKDTYALLGDYRERIYSFNFISKSFWKLFFESPKDFFVKFTKLYLLFIYNYYLKNKLNKICGFFNPDIIHCHFGWGFYDLYRIAGDSCFEYPLVISLHGSDVTLMPKTNKKYLEALLYAGAKSGVFFTVNSKYLKKVCISLGIPESKICIIYNTVNENFLNNRKNCFSTKIHSIKIVNIGRFIGWKGQKYLIQAFSKFHEEYPQSELTLIGSGETKKDMVQLVNSLDIKSNVNFIGDIKHSLIPYILSNHDVYVQPSIVDPETEQIETFGVAVLEAILVGLPVIVTNSGGMPEVVGKDHLNKYAFIVPEKDSNAILKTLKFLVSGNYKFQDNLEYAKDRLKFFSNEEYFERLKKIYDQVVNH